MRALIKVLELISEYSGRAIAWFTTLLVLLICYDVTMRYLFNDSAVWMQELEWHLFAALFLVAAAYTLKQDAHVRVDVFYARFSPKAKAWINLLGTLIFLFPMCIILLAKSWDFAATSWMIKERSADPGGLAARYVIKSMIPFGTFLLLIQGIAEGLKSIQTLFPSQTGSSQAS